jgi:hypothetical protein
VSLPRKRLDTMAEDDESGDTTPQSTPTTAKKRKGFFGVFQRKTDVRRIRPLTRSSLDLSTPVSDDANGVLYQGWMEKQSLCFGKGLLRICDVPSGESNQDIAISPPGKLDVARSASACVCSVKVNLTAVDSKELNSTARNLHRSLLHALISYEGKQFSRENPGDFFPGLLGAHANALLTLNTAFSRISPLEASIDLFCALAEYHSVHGV